jgi:hypothetical protein
MSFFFIPRLYNAEWGLLLDNDLERICKEAVSTCFKVISQYLPVKTEENYKKKKVKMVNLWAEI